MFDSTIDFDNFLNHFAFSFPGPSMASLQPGQEGSGTNTGGSSSGSGYTCTMANNPCAPTLAIPGQYYYPHAEAGKFIQCGPAGLCYEKNCPAGLTWNVSSTTCT